MAAMVVAEDVRAGTNINAQTLLNRKIMYTQRFMAIFTINLGNRRLRYLAIERSRESD